MEGRIQLKVFPPSTCTIPPAFRIIGPPGFTLRTPVVVLRVLLGIGGGLGYYLSLLKKSSELPILSLTYESTKKA